MSASDANTRALQKVSTDDFSAGGVLSPEQFNQFFEDVQAEANFLNQAQMFDVSADSGAIPRLGVGSRLIRGVGEGESANLVSVDQPDVDFETSKVSLPWELTHEAVSQNITGQSIEAQIRSMFAQQLANDLEILASVGDTGSGDAFESIEDGWLTIAANRGSPTYDHASATVDKSLFSEMLSTIPEEHKQTGNLVYLMSDAQKDAYKEYLTDRNSGAGDQMLMTGDEPTPFGRDIMTPLGWPDDQAMLVNPQNLAYIVNDELRVKQTREGERVTLEDVEVLYNLLAKVDYQILDETGAVVANNIATS